MYLHDWRHLTSVSESFYLCSSVIFSLGDSMETSPFVSCAFAHCSAFPAYPVQSLSIACYPLYTHPP